MNRNEGSSGVGTTDPSSIQPAASSRVNRAESNGEIGALAPHGVASPTPGGISSGVSGAQSNGEIGVPPQHGVASPSPGGIPSGVSGAESNGEIRVLPQHGVASPIPGGIPSGVSGAKSNGGVVFSSTNTNRPSAPLQQRSWCACICGTCTGTPTRHDNAYNGPEHFRVRELSDAEAHHLKSPLQDPCLKKMKYSRIFEEPLDRLKVWPMFFDTTEKSGLELRDGFVTLWSTFMLAESLLAGVAMQPFITNVPGLDGWRFEMYGLVWMLALVFDYMGLSVTALFLGYLHSPPAKLSYFWVCNIGAWIGVPAVLVLLAASVSLVAIAYSSWVIYGFKVGIVSISVEGFVIIFAILTSTSLGKGSRAAESLK